MGAVTTHELTCAPALRRWGVRFVGTLIACSCVWLASCGSNSPVACTAGSCAQVAGIYNATLVGGSTKCSGGNTLYIDNQSGTLGVSQADDQLSADLGSGFVLAGTLHADGSAQFGPIAGVAVDESGGGRDVPGKVYFFGWFADDNANLAAFEGMYMFIADEDGCELDAHFTWTHATGAQPPQLKDGWTFTPTVRLFQ